MTKNLAKNLLTLLLDLDWSILMRPVSDTLEGVVLQNFLLGGKPPDPQFSPYVYPRVLSSRQHSTCRVKASGSTNQFIIEVSAYTVPNIFYAPTGVEQQGVLLCH